MARTKLTNAGRGVVRIAVAVVMAVVGGFALVIVFPSDTSDSTTGSQITGVAAFCAGMALGVFLALSKTTWRRRIAVFAAATFAIGIVLFFSSAWPSRYDTPAARCFLHIPTSFYDRARPPYGTSGPLEPSGAHLGLLPVLDDAHIQRLPPGVQCNQGKASYFVAANDGDWLTLLGYSVAAGFVATATLLWLLALLARREVFATARRA